MPLNSGLFKGQDQSEADLGGSGWTIDQQTPSFFDNVVGSPFRGIAQGAANGTAHRRHARRRSRARAQEPRRPTSDAARPV